MAVLALTFGLPLLFRLGLEAGWAGADLAGRWFFGLVLAGTLGVLAVQGEINNLPWTDRLPLHLCDWAMIAALLACLGRWRGPSELAYFWGLAGTVHGLATPDLDVGFPHLGFILFMAVHGGIVATVLHLLLCSGFRPAEGGARRAFLWLLVYAAVAGSFNLWAGTNYGYLAAKPSQPSLLDHLGPWPWYIASLAAVGGIAFTVLAAPWALARRFGSGPVKGVRVRSRA